MLAASWAGGGNVNSGVNSLKFIQILQHAKGTSSI
jgi:hypothetical protein